MWTRKASFTFTGGIALILIGMMIANLQMMILGISFIAFIVVNSWISGHGDVEVQRTLSADNLYKGDDLYVELLVTNRSNRNTQLLEVYDNIPLPHYKIEYSESYTSLVGEDVYFCNRAGENGYEVNISHELSDRIAHIGTRAFTVKGDCND